jgi:pimeloyl-ACP methyl ester carboxylesterase
MTCTKEGGGVQAQQATVRGVPMRWTEVGEGFPVVLVHGIPTSPALWRHVLPQVHGGRCLAFEMVGYGNSIPAGRDRDISVARQADYLLGWLEQLGVERAVLVGHDLGGGVAQIAAVHQPRRCAGLVLADAILLRLLADPQRPGPARPGRSWVGCRRRCSRRWRDRLWPAAATIPRSPGSRRPSITTL